MSLATARLLLLAIGLAAALPAAAVFKCEQGGKVSYSDLPCGDGKILDLNTVPAADGGGPRQAAREKTLLKALEQDRHKRESAEARELNKASRASAARHKKCAAHQKRQQRANQEMSRTTGLANEKARRRFAQVTEDYENECGRWYERELGLAR